MNLSTNIMKNSGHFFSGRFISGIIALVVNIMLARYLGVSDYGLYSFVIAYSSIFAVFIDFGMETSIVRELSKNWKKGEKLLNGMVSLKIILSIVSVLSSITIAYFLTADLITTFLIGVYSVGFMFDSITSASRAVFRSGLQIKYSSIAMVFGKIASTLIILYLIFNSGSLIQILMAFIIEKAVVSMLCYHYYRKFTHLKLEFNKETWLKILKLSWPFLLTSIFYVLYFKTDVIMLSIMKGEDAVGYYSAAFKLMESLLLIPAAISMSTFPVMSKYFKRSINKFKRSFELSFRPASCNRSFHCSINNYPFW